LDARVEDGGDGLDGVRKRPAELVEGQDLVVPGVFVGLGDARPRDDVVELAAHDRVQASLSRRRG